MQASIADVAAGSTCAALPPKRESWKACKTASPTSASRRSWVPVEPETPMSRNRRLEAAAGADVSVDLCHAPEFTLMQRLPQHNRVAASG